MERFWVDGMKHNLIETLMGAVVLCIAGLFLAIGYQSGYGQTTAGITYEATFDRIDGLVVGADVKISGVKVGTVASVSVDPKSYLATVKLRINEQMRLPKDTSAEIVSEGLLGGKFMALVPGGDEDFIAPGGAIVHTQSSVNLESLIGQLIFSKKDDEHKDEKKDQH
jgi:phospholipid/cholesterol/gamma-HCH transport system substrate-binding protein